MPRKAGSLTYQIKKNFDAKLAIGESKFDAKKTGNYTNYIYSWDTYKSYLKHANYFAKHCKEYHNCKTLKDCRPFVDEWIQMRIDQGLSPYTIKLETASLAKLYGCSTNDFIKTPSRNRENITRSRGEKIRDKHFSEKNNQLLVNFCKGVGFRRHEIAKLKGTDLILKNGKYYVKIIGKGGKYRESLILPQYENEIVNTMKKAGNSKVFDHIPSNADIHSYRRDYATAIYKANARSFEECKTDKFYNAEHYNGKGKRKGGYDKDSVYRIRGCNKDKWLDKKAMKAASEALGHNRISVVGEHYINV